MLDDEKSAVLDKLVRRRASLASGVRGGPVWAARCLAGGGDVKRGELAILSGWRVEWKVG